MLLGAVVYYFFLRTGPRPEWSPENALNLSAAPLLQDAMTAQSLADAVDQSLRYFDKQDPESAVAFGAQWVKVSRISESLLHFKTKLLELGLTSAFFVYVRESFSFFKSAAAKVLFTGYYEADLRGSLTKTETYKYPLYKKPDDLFLIDLSKYYFYDRAKKIPAVIRGRLNTDRTIVPYHNRQAIDNKGILKGRDLEIVWIDNPVDVFFLHIQGSGIVQLDNGEQMRVNYADANGHPYNAIGRLLLQQGALTRENISMQSIRRYLESHPQQMDDIFNYNPSYVFFRVVDEGPIGSIGVPLTPYRSLATDRRLMPRGALCFVETELPVLDEEKNLTGWKPFQGFVLNQDTGGAIRGADRADLFTGYGETSRLTAGYMKQPGTFYFLLLKENHPIIELPN